MSRFSTGAADVALRATLAGVVKLVFMAYRNIEDFLGPDVASSSTGGVEATERIINSRVIAASVNSRHLMKLHQPVLITFQHREVSAAPRCTRSLQARATLATVIDTLVQFV